MSKSTKHLSQKYTESNIGGMSVCPFFFVINNEKVEIFFLKDFSKILNFHFIFIFIVIPIQDFQC